MGRPRSFTPHTPSNVPELVAFGSQYNGQLGDSVAISKPDRLSSAAVLIPQRLDASKLQGASVVEFDGNDQGGIALLNDGRVLYWPDTWNVMYNYWNKKEGMFEVQEWPLGTFPGRVTHVTAGGSLSPYKGWSRMMFFCVSVEHGGSAGTAHSPVHCWGHGYYGEMGDGIANPHVRNNYNWRALTPLATDWSNHEAGGTREITSLSAGYQHACATLNGASVWCWGAGANGAIGKGAGYTDVSKPTQVHKGGAVWAGSIAQVEASHAYACARTTGGVTGGQEGLLLGPE